MCGITGFFDFTSTVREHAAADMASAMPHRGPDGQGLFFEHNHGTNIGLSHRRLSIIDLSHSADQPMFFENFVIVFNGEIYNYAEIKKELLDLGHTFQTSSDTEVILHAFAEWKEACVQRFIGMFAFVIYNRENGDIWMFRDRTGIKPLYYSVTDKYFIFASELKCFHQYPDFRKVLNQSAVAKFLQYGYVSGQQSIFSGVEKLAPGCFLHFNCSARHVTIKKYWDAAAFYEKEKRNISLEDAVQETESIIADACRYRMVADVPVGVFLSGGYDSTLVTSLLQKNNTDKIRTFTIGVEDEHLNEAAYAAEIAKHLGTEHTEIYCTAEEMLPLVEQIPFYFDEPFGDSSAVPTMLVSRLAREHVTVALSADGGDEVFGGYNRYDYTRHLPKIKAASYLPLPYKSIFSLLKKNSQEAERFAAIIKNPDAYHLADLLNVSVLNSDIHRLFLKDVADQSITPFNNYNIKGDLSKMMYYDYVTYLPDDILTKVDRATMSASLEGREPLLDHRILEFAATLPEDYKYRAGEKKYLLKQIVHQYVPANIMERPKMGFGVPVKSWLENALSEKLDYYLSEAFITRQNIFSYPEITGMRDRIISGKDKHYQKLWYMLMFQMWYEKWMN
ncbi:asparagine synthase (glutamine-hydrolyzing) [Chryseobacterium sp. 6424]|uniref:asparagine synthase (glutamine-hydrolyzing) n=1 Tax=Chryseobacterium sp. 6424 TaxID=2039166 RepID=UPI000EFB6E79|nr:asparagine synthase (glutamine-hydrolyzing) [Chryseobacterium sp. 6424]AYO56923.1 asparagine synthase (glutamine-hydrolyzing) [Chryseobacterium sp. 6424]